VTGDHDAKLGHEPHAVVHSIVGRRIDDLIDLAAKNRAEGLRQARVLREWLRRQRPPPQAQPGVREAIKELDILIDTIGKYDGAGG
jgi:hypothetical protein